MTKEELVDLVQQILQAPDAKIPVVAKTHDHYTYFVNQMYKKVGIGVAGKLLHIYGRHGADGRSPSIFIAYGPYWESREALELIGILERKHNSKKIEVFTV